MTRIAETQPLAETHKEKVYVRRHALVTRITHWINALCILILLPSGLQILMTHPAIYWGQCGSDRDRTSLEIGAEETDDGALKGFCALAGRPSTRPAISARSKAPMANGMTAPSRPGRRCHLIAPSRSGGAGISFSPGSSSPISPFTTSLASPPAIFAAISCRRAGN